MALFVFLYDFISVPTVWHYLFLLNFGTVSDSVNIICFSMRLWNYSHSVALSVYLLYFGTDQTFWHDCFFMGLWNSTDSGPLFVVLLYLGTVLTV